MGFRNGAYATVWETKSVSNTMTEARISISRKNKDAGGYTQDFGGFVTFIGTDNANKALKLKPRDRIKLDQVDVSTTYNAETKRNFTNFKVFSFESIGKVGGNTSNSSSPAEPEPKEDEAISEEDDLPF